MNRAGRVSYAKRVGYYLRVGFGLLRGKQTPAVAGISITDCCNLACEHCWRNNQGAGHASFGGIQRTLDTLYELGGRYLYIQGGEPLAWEDGELSLGDVVQAARKRGFFHVAVCTNGTFPLTAKPDSFSVSLEGRRETHDAIRCGTFDRVFENIKSSSHPNIFLNATFNQRNAEDLPFLADLAGSLRKVRGLLVNFHIPYPGVEHLALPLEKRAVIARDAYRLKKEGYPILNTYGGLVALERNDWKRPLDLSVVSDCRSVYSCCRARGNDAVCRECGYGGWAELAKVLEWDIASVFQVLRRLHG